MFLAWKVVCSNWLRDFDVCFNEICVKQSHSNKSDSGSRFEVLRLHIWGFLVFAHWLSSRSGIWIVCKPILLWLQDSNPTAHCSTVSYNNNDKHVAIERSKCSQKDHNCNVAREMLDMYSSTLDSVRSVRSLSLIRDKPCLSDFDGKNTDAYKRRIAELEMEIWCRQQHCTISRSSTYSAGTEIHFYA